MLFEGASTYTVDRLRWIPEIGIDDQGKWISISQAIEDTGMDPSTVRDACNAGKLVARKDRNGQWQIRLKSWTKFVERYRYGKLGTRTGRWWTAQELEVIDSGISIAFAARLLNRSYGAVKVKRSKRRTSATLHAAP